MAVVTLIGALILTLIAWIRAEAQDQPADAIGTVAILAISFICLNAARRPANQDQPE